VPVQDLLPELERWFKRKTFEEGVCQCTDQNWIGRYDGARETHDRLARDLDRVRAACPRYQVDLYERLLRLVESYAMDIRALLLRAEPSALPASGDLGIPEGIRQACERRRARINEGQPGGPVGSGVAWPVVLCEHTTNDVLVKLDAEGVRDLLGDPYTAEPGIAALHLDNRRDECCRQTFAAGFAVTVAGGKESSISPIHQGLVELNLSSVAGLTSAPRFGIPARTHEQSAETEHQAIEGGEIRSAMAAPIADSEADC